MKRYVGGAALLVAGALAMAGPGAGASEPVREAPMAITHVTVIDATGRPERPDMTVIVAEGRIRAIGSSRDVKAPPGAAAVDGTGKFLIPGLWNMHLHAGSYDDARKALPSLLASGVTGVRDMGAPPADVLRLRADIRSGTLTGPRLVLAGPLLQGPLPFDLPLIRQVKSAEDAEPTVSALQAQGVDFVKVHDALPHDIYLAIAMAAKRHHIAFAGHVPPTVKAAEASDLGQRSIEHLGGQFLAELVGASKDEDRLFRESAGFYDADIAALKAGKAPPAPNLKADYTRALLDSYDDRKAALLFARFRRNETWQCPTLVALPGLWSDTAEPLTDEDKTLAVRIVAKEAMMVGEMRRAGVHVLAGTDGPYGGGGARLDDELALLVQAGLSPMQAIESATREPAVFLGLKDLGTVEVGKRANLVMLTADPAKDIRNIRAVAMVLLDGRPVAGPLVMASH